MMRILLALLCLLALATSASAECAWVLWVVAADVEVATGKTRVLPSDWPPEAGFTNAAACVTAQTAFVQDERARFKDRHDNGPGVRTTFLYRCLPDTVDPRGPKGK